MGYRPVVPGGGGGAMEPPDDRSVNPISTRRTDYAHLITSGTPGFSDLLTALYEWQTSRGNKGRMFVDKKGEFS